MPGVKGMKHRPSSTCARRKVWNSMRVLMQMKGRFSVPDLCVTSKAKVNNVRKFLRQLKEHGYVAKTGSYTSGRAGSYQGWRLVKDLGPEYPTRCERCGRPLAEPCDDGCMEER